MQYFSGNSIKPTLKYYPNQYYSKLLEKCHIFQDNGNSLYLKTVKNIVNGILKNNIKYIPIQLYAKQNTIFKCYEIINPFQNIPLLNIISKLKIYINSNDDKNAYVIASELDKNFEKEYNPEVLPLYKSDSTTVQVISIIIENIDINANLYDILTHEFRHGLDYIKDSKLTQRTNHVNYPYDILKDNAISTTNKEYKALYNLAADCTYYTQDTEIKAHLENAYNELIECHYTREELLDFYQYLNSILDELPFMDFNKRVVIRQMIKEQYTYVYYFELKCDLEYWVNKFKNNPESYKEIGNEIISIVYYESPQELPYKNDFLKLLKKWHKQICKFIKFFNNYVYQHYNQKNL